MAAFLPVSALSVLPDAEGVKAAVGNERNQVDGG
jgi:hypothetical protein